MKRGPPCIAGRPQLAASNYPRGQAKPCAAVTNYTGSGVRTRCRKRSRDRASRRETCICEMPSRAAICVCVMFSKNRSRSTVRSRQEARRATATVATSSTLSIGIEISEGARTDRPSSASPPPSECLRTGWCTRWRRSVLHDFFSVDAQRGGDFACGGCPTQLVRQFSRHS